MRGKDLLVVGIVVALLSVPPAAVAQSSTSDEAQGGTDEITFYGHVFSAGLPEPMPANTEAPVGEANLGLGFGVNCQNEGPTIPGAPVPFAPTDEWQHCDDEAFNKLALFSTAGPVDVENRVEFYQNGAYGQLHNERGQTKPVLLDSSGKITATVFGTWDTHGWPVGFPNAHDTACVPPHPPNVPCIYPYWGWDPGVYQDVVMKATLYHADLGERSNSSAAPPVQEAIMNDEATVVAEGQWGPGQVMNGLPGAPNAFQWDVELGTPQVDQIPRSDDFFLVYSTYQSTDAATLCFDCPMRWWSGEFFPPTFTLPVENAFAVERVVPNFANGKMAVLGIINTPWGSYDVDSQSVDLTIEGPNGEVNPDEIDRFADFSVAHGGHFKPVNLTWIWDYRAEGVTSGEYQVTVSAQNLQGTANAECQASFTLEEDDRGRLVPGETEPAACGIQGVATDEALEEAQKDVNTTSEGS